MIKIMLLIPLIMLAIYFYPSRGEEYEKHTISIDKIIEIDELFITKITIADYGYIVKKDGIILITKGYIYYYISFKNIDIIKLDKNIISIAINKPKFDIELDENVTSLYLKDEDKKIHKDILIEYSKQAEDNLKTAAEKNIYKARKQAEEFIIGYLKQFDYTIKKVYWRDLTKENLSKETLNDINFDILSKLVLCNESNNNKLKEIDLKYTIERNAGVDPLILSKDVDKKFGDCVENSLKEIKHEEYYGKEEKIQKSFNLDKDKICQKLRKKDSWFNSNSEKFRKLNCKEEIEENKEIQIP
jgi:hypothetical protein